MTPAISPITRRLVEGVAPSFPYRSKDRPTVKQGKATTVQDRSGKCLTEERQIEYGNQWTECCSELYNHKANGDPSVLNCPQTDTEDDHPILRREVEAVVQPRRESQLESTTSQQNWSKQVERMLSTLSRQFQARVKDVWRPLYIVHYSM